ncbi:hypothetical protein JCM19236_2698 [Vibrio sp. JCM 19236]|nr:hypothetical protein JCM19236_2698 [Vibrio sp. JCM 19236]
MNKTLFTVCGAVLLSLGTVAHATEQKIQAPSTPTLVSENGAAAVYYGESNNICTLNLKDDLQNDYWMFSIGYNGNTGTHGIAFNSEATALKKFLFNRSKDIHIEYNHEANEDFDHFEGEFFRVKSREFFDSLVHLQENENPDESVFHSFEIKQATISHTEEIEIDPEVLDSFIACAQSAKKKGLNG